MASQFQFTPLCERLQEAIEVITPIYLFQFTPLCERLLCAKSFMIPRKNFNSRLSARGYLVFGLQFTDDSRYFNSRLSARGYSRITVTRTLFRYFNSRLSARGYHASRTISSSIFISIHASLREATNRRPITLNGGHISIHASLREATIMFQIMYSVHIFQFTPLCERLQQKQPIYSCILA